MEKRSSLYLFILEVYLAIFCCVYFVSILSIVIERILYRLFYNNIHKECYVLYKNDKTCRQFVYTLDKSDAKTVALLYFYGRLEVDICLLLLHGTFQ
jgi:hypothetical protein